MVGIDLVDIDRIEKALASTKFVQEVFTLSEREYCKKAENFAGIYCAKEAFVKAVGTGLTRSSFGEIEVLHYENGAPYYNLKGKASEALDKRKAHLPISHDKGVAIAICMLEK